MSKTFDEMTAIEKDDYISALTVPACKRVAKHLGKLGLSEKVQLAKSLGFSPIHLSSILESAAAVLVLSAAGIPWNYTPADVARSTKAMDVAGLAVQ